MADKRTKVCHTCRKVFEYETVEELKKFFYKKGSWFRNTCKKCECADHAKKYKSGQYNYRKKRQSSKNYTFGVRDISYQPQ